MASSRHLDRLLRVAGAWPPTLHRSPPRYTRRRSVFSPELSGSDRATRARRHGAGRARQARVRGRPIPPLLSAHAPPILSNDMNQNARPRPFTHCHKLVCPGPLRQRAIESNLSGYVFPKIQDSKEHNMPHGRYSIETRNGADQSTYNEIFHIIGGRKEFVAKTSVYIDSAKREAETEKIIEEHQILDQT